MDYSKLPKLNIIALVLAVALGVIVAVIVYQAQIRGLVPVIGENFTKPESLKTQTVIQEENAVTLVVEKALPAIVSISQAGVKNENGGIGGVGFIVDKKGLVVTNKHTVSDSGQQYVVVTNDGQKFEVKNVYKDPSLDLSLVAFDANNLAFLELGDSSVLKLGQTVIAMGQSRQSVNSVSVGVVSGLNRLIQTDALVDSNNLGGPLLSSAGQVIGVSVTATGSQSFGSAIPVNDLKQLIASVAQGSAKPILGLTYKFISKDLAVLNGIQSGASVQEVSTGGPADKAGIKVGDIITKINGQAVDTEETVSGIISKGKVGQQLELTIWRNRQELTVNATLGIASNQ